MTRTLSRATAVWLLILVAAVLNGTFRELVLNPWLGREAALPVSGLLLALLVLWIARSTRTWIGPDDTGTSVAAGGWWFLLTLAFELLAGRVAAGRPWPEVLRAFRFWEGDLFALVLLVTAAAPWLSARVRARRQPSNPSS